MSYPEDYQERPHLVDSNIWLEDFGQTQIVYPHSHEQWQEIWDELASNSVDVAKATRCNTLEDFLSTCVTAWGILAAADGAQPEAFQYTCSGSLVGIAFLKGSNNDGECNFGIVLLSWARKRGWAQRAAKLALGWIFNEAGYRRVQVDIFPGKHRAAALRLFARLAFYHEGTKRAKLLSPYSFQFEDVTYMGLLATDFAIRELRRDIPWSRWDEMLLRHQTERESLLELEAVGAPLKRSASTETLRQLRNEDVEERPKKRALTISDLATPGSHTFSDYCSSEFSSGTDADSTSSSVWHSVRRHDARAAGMDSENESEWDNTDSRLDELHRGLSDDDSLYADDIEFPSQELPLAGTTSMIPKSPSLAPSPPESHSSQESFTVLENYEEERERVPLRHGGVGTSQEENPFALPQQESSGVTPPQSSFTFSIPHTQAASNRWNNAPGGFCGEPAES